MTLPFKGGMDDHTGFADPDERFETCPYCDGLGVETFGVTVYEHGCGFPHASTDERPCPECEGNGVRSYYRDEPLDPMRGAEFPFAENH